ncbi:three-Cys-motif partner protein TcmP [Hyphobacterium sp. SN044]|uniref:three-Cys-motif partner protein TcmP n=1 Tax=Hyphobacterium sp. SN044 TaxID=2912575 RepID=UPI001F42367A|nr:three-Cys-motif partner protein TcmP [Hyphobacterium sp. SN044]MCF8878285.1 three-Cys-motif partner protein TcmP [Hyphobacterium sp. SN044]
MEQIPFGSTATDMKLDVISEYLTQYKRVMHGAQAKQRRNGWRVWDTMYIDAFAGTGGRPLKKEDIENQDKLLETDESIEEFKVGSALRALTGKQSFDHYIFIEEKRKKLNELRERVSDHALAERCVFVQGDSNQKLVELCENTSWRDRRAVVFLDPFGNSVAWDTVEKIAQTRAIDLWYLFPSGNGVFRQISNLGRVTPESAKSLDRLFGTPDWRNEFVAEEVREGLFGHTVELVKAVTPESATDFMIKRMRSVFAGGVLDHTLPLGDLRHGYPLYSLIFAWANDGKRAGEIASGIAKSIIESRREKSGWLF